MSTGFQALKQVMELARLSNRTFVEPLTGSRHVKVPRHPQHESTVACAAPKHMRLPAS